MITTELFVRDGEKTCQHTSSKEYKGGVKESMSTADVMNLNHTNVLYSMSPPQM
jgi:hypothetical protein